jgi:hydroxymethylpyrimidine/phosphomethylpyrimidine kinase
MIPRVLSIAGSDSGGGAGIQADLKTFGAFGAFGMTAVCAVTAQNTLGVKAAYELPVELIEQQLDCVCQDLGVDAAKTGMLSSSQVVRAVAAKIRQYGLSPLVVDPVMISKNGTPILADEAVETLLASLVPLATVLTPNRHEAERLTGLSIVTEDDFVRAGKLLVRAGAKWVVVKGGHSADEGFAVDVATDGVQVLRLPAVRIMTPHTHGTGCTFSAAIAACLGRGMAVPEALFLAKEYISCAIASAPGLGGGHGPTNHLCGLQSRWMSTKENRT